MLVHIPSETTLYYCCCFADLQFAECMRNLLVAVEEEDLRKLLERSHEVAMDAATMADQDTAGEYWSLMLVQVAGSSSLTSQTQPTY